MSALESWFLQQQDRQERFSSLSDLMFDESHVQYPIYRLSLFNFKVMTLFITHAVLFYYMFQEFSSHTFTFLISISSWKIFFMSLWWGGLETLRTQVRYAYRAKNLQEVNKTIGFWISLSMILCLPLLAASGYFVYEIFERLPRRLPIVEQLYLLITFVSLVIHLPVSVFHAGIYSFTRIIRPQFSVILSHLLGLSTLMITWPIIGMYAIILAIFIQAITTSCLTYHYTLYMYKLYDLWPEKPKRKEFRKRLLNLPIINFFVGGAANIFIAIDAILIIVFYFFSLGKPQYVLYVQIIYLISPLIRATSDWARLFYFDRKKLEKSRLTLFVQQYDRIVDKVAAFMGFFFGIYSIIACLVLITSDSGLLTLTLMPFFILRAMIANLQVKTFCENRFFDLIVSGIFLVAGIISIAFLEETLFLKSLFLTLLMVVIYKFLGKTRFPKLEFETMEPNYTNLYAWLANIKHCDELVEVVHVKIDPHSLIRQKMELIRKLKETFQLTDKQICLYGADSVLFYQPISSAQILLPNTTYAELGKGIINHIEQDLVYTNRNVFDQTGLDYSYIDSPIINHIKERAFVHVDIRNIRVSDEEIKSTFSELFPDGVYYDPKRNLGPEAEAPSLETLRKFTSLIWQYLYHKKAKKKSDFDLTVLYDDLVKVVFLIPKKANNEEFGQKLKYWYQYIHANNIKRAVESVIEEEPQVFGRNLEEISLRGRI